MDDRTGDIHSWESVQLMAAEDQRHMKPIAMSLSRNQRRTGKVGRNDPCPCASGLKFKKCCLVSAACAV